MKTAAPLERSRAVIQGWFSEFCKFHGTPTVVLRVKEEGESDTAAYKVTNTSHGKKTKIFKRTVSDYESSGSVGIPGELKGEI